MFLVARALCPTAEDHQGQILYITPRGDSHDSYWTLFEYTLFAFHFHFFASFHQVLTRRRVTELSRHVSFISREA